MHYRLNNRYFKALTLVEMIIAMAIMAIVFAVVLPQFRLIQNSWDTKAGASEALQNGRILIDHINHNLSQALRIIAVSDSSEINGYIEFQSNDENKVRYDISIDNYVEFGTIGNLYDLAGPVSKLQFTCYGAADLSAPITDVNAIRSVKVETTLVNPAKLDQNMTFSTQTYIRTNTLSAVGGNISKMSEPWIEFDNVKGMDPALCQIDQTHYLCAYRGDGDDGFAAVLTVDTDTWNVSKEPVFEYDTVQGLSPALAKIDTTQYLCAYQGQDGDGWAKILKVNTIDWTISQIDDFEFDLDLGQTPALVQIDQTHYLCAYTGPGDDGWAVVLTIAAPLFDAISMETPFEFETTQATTTALSKIDDTHYLCAYQDKWADGWAVVLTINTGNWTISKETSFEFEIQKSSDPALAKIDDTHYLCAYLGNGDLGFVTVLTVDTGNWTITNTTPFEYDTVGMMPAISNVDNTHGLSAYMGQYSDGWAVVLTVDTADWTVSKKTPFEFDIADGAGPALAKIDENHYLCAYTGTGGIGLAGVLRLAEEILP